MKDPEADEHLTACLAGAKVGDVHARDELVRILEQPLLGFLRARGVREPHDMANEVLIRVFNGLGTFDGNAPQFRAWVFRITRNLLIDQKRLSDRRPDTVPTAPHDIPDQAGPLIDLDGDSDHRVERLLEQLTADQREVLLLRVVAGLTVDETAEVVDRNVGAVRALQHRALARVRRNFSHHP